MKPKNNFLGILLVAAAIVIGGFFLIDAPDHIEDTNGPDDYSLNTITQQDIIDCTMGAVGGPSTREQHIELAGIGISSGVEFYAKKFTGVYAISTSYTIGDIDILLSDFVIESGNLQLCVVIDDQIAATIEPGDTVDLILEDVKGNVRFIIAGESAAFHFTALHYPGQ